MANLSNINNYFVVNTSGLVAVGDASSSVLPGLTVPFTVFKSGADSILSIQSGGGSGKPYFLRSNTSGSFSIYDDLACLERLTILSGGNVGIGETNPNAKLDVPGNVKLGSAAHSSWTDAKQDIGGVDIFIGSGSKAFQVWDDNDQTNARFIVERAGNVGIGTTTPGNTLDVAGDTDITGQLVVSHDANYVAKFVNTATSMSNDNYALMVNSSSHTSNMTAAGAMSVDVNSGRAFTINGIGRVSIGGNTQSANTLTLTGSATELDIENTSGKRYRFNCDTSGNLRFEDKTGGTEVMRFASSNNVGIGTTSPSYKLDVESSSDSVAGVYIQAGKSSQGEIQNTGLIVGSRTDMATNDYLGISFTGNAATPARGRAAIGVKSTNGTSAMDLVFMTRNAADGSQLGSADEKMRIDSSGNVGIGTTSPTAKLEVVCANGANAFRANFGSAADIFMGFDNANPYLILQDNGNTTTHNFKSNDTNNYIVGSNLGIGTTTPTNMLSIKGTSGSSKGLDIYHSNGNKVAELIHNGSGDEGMLRLLDSNSETVRIAGENNISSFINSGNVGIGTTSPNQKLDVAGSISSGGENKATSITHDTSGNVRAFVHNFSRNKDTSGASNVTLVDISGLGNFHQAMFYVQYGTRLQAVSDSTTGAVVRTYGVNRFNGGTLQVTETNAIAGSSNSITHALVNVEIVSNTQYRLRIEFSSTLGASSFATGLINGFAVGDAFPTITFAEGTAGE